MSLNMLQCSDKITPGGKKKKKPWMMSHGHDREILKGGQVYGNERSNNKEKKGKNFRAKKQFEHMNKDTGFKKGKNYEGAS